MTRYPDNITVRQLMELLRNCDPDLPVWIEGCDCFGGVVGISHTEGAVIVRQKNGVCQDNPEPEPVVYP